MKYGITVTYHGVQHAQNFTRYYKVAMSAAQ